MIFGARLSCELTAAGRASVRRRLDAELDVGLSYTGIGSTEAQRAPTSAFPVALRCEALVGLG
jgi:hypothetical protein